MLWYNDIYIPVYIIEGSVKHMCYLYLEFPSKKRQEDAKAYLKETIDSGSDINGMGDLDKHEDFDEWLKVTKNYRNGTDIAKYHVRATEYFLIRKKDDKIVGMTNIRHELNDFLKDTGYGHIGYSIRPSERQKGYGTAQLILALEKCRELGIQKVHVGCFEINTASKKTIEKCGGRLFRQKETDGKPYLEYVIDNF